MEGKIVEVKDGAETRQEVRTYIADTDEEFRKCILEETSFARGRPCVCVIQSPRKESLLRTSDFQHCLSGPGGDYPPADVNVVPRVEDKPIAKEVEEEIPDVNTELEDHGVALDKAIEDLENARDATSYYKEVAENLQDDVDSIRDGCKDQTGKVVPANHFGERVRPYACDEEAIAVLRNE